MSSYRDLQKIYEGAWTFGPNRGRVFTGNESEISLSRGPGQLPMQGPGGKVNAYNISQSSSSNPIRFADDEESEVEEKQVSNRIILDKIDELKRMSDDEGMDYATMMLGKLGEFIKDL